MINDGMPSWFPWAAVFMFTLIVNAGETIVFAFGVVLPSIVAEFSVSISMISLAPTIHHLVLGLTAPFVGRLLDIFSIRLILSIGSTLLIAGCLIASQAGNVYVLLFAYVVFGFAGVFLHPMVAIKYVSNLFTNRVGLATGLAIWPFSLVVFPPIAHLLVEEWGWRSFYIAMGLYALGAFFLVPILKQQAGPKVGKSPTTRPEDELATTSNSELPLPTRKLYKVMFTNSRFWVLVLSTAVLNSIGVTLLTHLVVFGAGKGLMEEQAVTLISFWGAAVLVGLPSAGLFLDKFGPRVWYVTMSLLNGLAVSGLLMTSSYSMLSICVLGIGLFISGTFVCFSGMLRVLVGDLNFGAVIGLTLLLMLPFTSLSPLLAGFVYDLSGSYNGYFAGLAFLLFSVCAIFLFWFESKPIDLHSRADEENLVPV